MKAKEAATVLRDEQLAVLFERASLLSGDLVELNAALETTAELNDALVAQQLRRELLLLVRDAAYTCVILTRRLA